MHWIYRIYYWSSRNAWEGDRNTATISEAKMIVLVQELYTTTRTGITTKEWISTGNCNRDDLRSNDKQFEAFPFPLRLACANRNRFLCFKLSIYFWILWCVLTWRSRKRDDPLQSMLLYALSYENRNLITWYTVKNSLYLVVNNVFSKPSLFSSFTEKFNHIRGY